MRVIRRLTHETLGMLQMLTDRVLVGEETLLRITRSGYSIDYIARPAAEWRSFPPVPAADPSMLVLSSDTAVFAAFEDERFIGMACVGADANGWAEVLDIRVDADSRRTGVGAMLLDACDSFAARRGLNGLKLTVTDDNPAICRFCGKYGFTLAGLDRMALICA